MRGQGVRGSVKNVSTMSKYWQDIGRAGLSCWTQLDPGGWSFPTEVPVQVIWFRQLCARLG